MVKEVLEYPNLGGILDQRSWWAKLGSGIVSSRGGFSLR